MRCDGDFKTTLCQRTLVDIDCMILNECEVGREPWIPARNGKGLWRSISTISPEASHQANRCLECTAI